MIFRGATSLDPKNKKALDDAIGFFELFLSEQEYAAGDHLTIADLSLLASASTMEVKIVILTELKRFFYVKNFASEQAVEPKIFQNHPKIKEWIARCQKQIPDYHELNQVGAEMFGKLAAGALEKILHNATLTDDK